MSQFPTINGVAHSFSTIHIDLKGVKYEGFASLNFKEELEQEPGFGTGIAPNHVKVGNWKGTLDFEMYLEEWVRFLGPLGDGYMLKPFNLGAHWEPLAGGGKIIPFTAPMVTIKGYDSGNSVGNLATMKAECCCPNPFILDGKTAFQRVGASASIGVAVSVGLGGVSAEASASAGFGIGF